MIFPWHLGAVSAAGLAAWCGPPPRPIAALLFLTGLVGGIAHCGPMCGPFVLAQAAANAGGAPVLRRLTGGLLLPYHLGRLATYAALGAAAAMLGAAIVALSPLRVAVAALLCGAALLFATQGLVRLAPQRCRIAPSDGWAAAWAGGLARLSGPLAGSPSPAARLALGAVLGLLPCGFLYGALAAAAATKNPGAGALAMVAFGLGTVPSLLLVGLGSAARASRWRALARRALAPLFLFNAAVLTAMAVAVASTP